MKNRIYSIFLSPSFASRPYFNQAQVLKGFQKFIEDKNSDTLLFWRLLNVELWLREFFPNSATNVDLVGQRRPISIEIKVGDKTYSRHLIRTDVFQKDDNYAQKI
ncbi:MAG: asparagine synthetase B, partial [Nanoarchaeota archaeon]